MAREDSSSPKPALVGLSSRAVFGHRKSITSVAWNSSGEKLLVAGDSAGVRVFDAAGLNTRDLNERDSTLYDGHRDSIEALVSSPACPHSFATAALDQTANLYDLRAGPRPTKSVKLCSGGIHVAWCPDGSCIVVGDNKDKLYVVEARRFEGARPSPKELSDAKLIAPRWERKTMINQMQWHRTGKVLFLARGDGQVGAYTWPGMDHIQYLSGHRANCLSIAVDPTGRQLAVSSDDSLISCWDASTLHCDFTIDRSKSDVRLLDYSHDGRYLASASGDGGIDVAQSAVGSHVTSITTGTRVSSLQWHPNRHVLAYSVEEPRRKAPVMAQRMYQNALPPPTPLPRAFVYGYPALQVDMAPASNNRHRPAQYQYQRQAGPYHR